MIEPPPSQSDQRDEAIKRSVHPRVQPPHQRSGHLFQGRYKAIRVDRESYFLVLARYIVLNPVRAALVKHPPPVGLEQLFYEYWEGSGRIGGRVWNNSSRKSFGRCPA